MTQEEYDALKAKIKAAEKLSNEIKSLNIKEIRPEFNGGEGIFILMYEPSGKDFRAELAAAILPFVETIFANIKTAKQKELAEL